jgi:hypothetical protein
LFERTAAHFGERGRYELEVGTGPRRCPGSAPPTGADGTFLAALRATADQYDHHCQNLGRREVSWPNNAQLVI